MVKPKKQTRPVRRPKNTPSKSRSLTLARTPAPTPRQGHAPGLLGGVGKAVGGWFGLPGLGEAAGNLLGKITGMGAYTLKRNSLLGSSAPSFGDGSGSVRFQRREFVQDVTTAGSSFNSVSYLINPGNSLLFPWLSRIAKLYTQYRFHGLVVYYNSTSADALNSTNTALGTVMMASNYDVDDRDFVTKPEMEQAQFSNSGPPSRNLIHGIECDPRQSTLTNLYIKHSSDTIVADEFYDMAKFQLATVGMQAACTVGELWVSYDVELMKPVVHSEDDDVGLFAHAVESPPNSATAAAPMGTGGGLIYTESTLGILTTSTTFTVPQIGDYLVIGTWSGVTITSAPGITYGGNMNFTVHWKNHSVGATTTYNTGTATEVGTFRVLATGTGAANTATWSGLATMAAAVCDLVIIKMDSGYFSPRYPSIISGRNARRLLARVQEEKEARDAALPPDSSVSVTSAAAAAPTQTSAALSSRFWGVRQ